MGQEERKNKAKLEKTQIQLATTSNEYEAAVKILEETTGRWNRDWKAACDKFQDLEEERLDFTKSSLWNFANIASTVCVSDDASCEKMRLSLEGCEVEKDIASFIRERGTGQEIPDPPKFINFCRGDVNDSASDISDDDSYSVAQFQRTINPAFRSSSPQPSLLDSHHDPQSFLAKSLGHGDPSTPPSREATMTPHRVAQQPPPSLDYSRQPNGQGQYGESQSQHGDFPAVPHNEYPEDGMTMFCRTGPPSDLSSARPSSRDDSQSEYSNPTSFSSFEPSSGKQSPTKPVNGVYLPGMDAAAPDQRKKNGFFTNSPFRRKSKHDRDPPAASRNTWAPTSSRNNQNRTSVFGSERQVSGSPEPVDPRANFQLNVGNNVFDVASPEKSRTNGLAPQKAQDDMDPIAQALAELKGVGKQSSVRQSADRYHGIATPAPGAGPGGVPPPLRDTNIGAAQRGTPPPAYDSARTLSAPQPAFTSAQMQKTTRKYVGQTQDMFTNAASRPGTRGSGHAQDIPRATSPAPPRSASPRPGIHGDNRTNQFRATSPSPGYNRNGNPSANRPRQTQSASPTKRGSDQGYNSYSRHGSPGDIRRAASPQPHQQPQQQPQQQPPYSRQERPGSSAGGGMQMQLAQPGQMEPYGGTPRGRGPSGRPMSYYGGDGGAPAPQDGRGRSKSMAENRQLARDGRPILHYGKRYVLKPQ